MLILDPYIDYTISYNNLIYTNVNYLQYPIKRTNIIIKNGNKVVRKITGHKPNGLWYSCGTDWMDFCETNSSIQDVTNINLPFIHRLIVDKNRFILLDSPQEIHSFNSKYALGVTGKKINWFQVSKQFDGIQILDFDKKKSSLYWYQSFDISSGCIWNLNKIISITRVNNNVQTT